MGSFRKFETISTEAPVRSFRSSAPFFPNCVARAPAARASSPPRVRVRASVSPRRPSTLWVVVGNARRGTMAGSLGAGRPVRRRSQAGPDIKVGRHREPAETDREQSRYQGEALLHDKIIPGVARSVSEKIKSRKGFRRFIHRRVHNRWWTRSRGHSRFHEEPGSGEPSRQVRKLLQTERLGPPAPVAPRKD